MLLVSFLLLWLISFNTSHHITSHRKISLALFFSQLDFLFFKKVNWLIRLSKDNFMKFLWMNQIHSEWSSAFHQVYSLLFGFSMSLSIFLIQDVNLIIIWTLKLGVRLVIKFIKKIKKARDESLVLLLKIASE